MSFDQSGQSLQTTLPVISSDQASPRFRDRSSRRPTSTGGLVSAAALPPGPRASA